MLSRLVVSQVKHNSYFLAGLALGLWVALVAVPLDDKEAPCAAPDTSSARADDEFAPAHETRPPRGGAGAAGAGAGAAGPRSVARPRYYSTELGMRAPLLAAVLTSEAALGPDGVAVALNNTARALQPALRLFTAASGAGSRAGGGAVSGYNVVAFTDARAMLQPFHALKFLADNHLDDYDFFFLVSDTSFVNGPRLRELVGRLSVSWDVYMGAVADDDTNYCTLEGGILLSNSVLRAVHGALDWCVRNSYSGRHHENIGRCVRHAAQLACQPASQGEQYTSVQLPGGGSETISSALRPSLADAVTAYPVTTSKDFYLLHTYVSRVQLERRSAELSLVRATIRWAGRRHPRGFRNATWPTGLRNDPGLAPTPPDNRWDHLRWTLFNATHAMLPTDTTQLGELKGAHKQAVDLVVSTARSWACRRHGAVDAALVEGAWRWSPATDLAYRLLMRLAVPVQTAGNDAPTEYHYRVIQMEVVRTLGAARLSAVPYVTESARVHVLLPVPVATSSRGAARAHVTAATAFLHRFQAAVLKRNGNAALHIVIVHNENSTPDEKTAHEIQSLKEAVSSLISGLGPSAATSLRLSEARAALAGRNDSLSAEEAAARAALAAQPAAPRDPLTLIADVYMEFSDDFLNRVRMNTIVGVQWFAAGAFRRHAQFAHPQFVDGNGNKPHQHTGRFRSDDFAVIAFYRSDFDHALTEYRLQHGEEAASSARAADILVTSSAVLPLQAPEPALMVAPPKPPCGLLSSTEGDPYTMQCLRWARDDGFEKLLLGGRAPLAQLLLQTRADADTSDAANAVDAQPPQPQPPHAA